MTINKQEFSNRLAVKLDKTKKEAGIITDAFLETLRESLVEDGKVMFVGDWSLETVPTKERTFKNPATGEDVVKEAGKRIKFKAGKLFKDSVGI
jgi:DNA-binding protein HU-beta